jgi:TRAP-type C4-dicarboxylate transport system permease small subunit
MASLLGVIRSTAVVLAYLGGAIVVTIALGASVSIIGRAAFNRPIVGDFELAGIGIFIAGSLMLPYCQLVRGHLAVDFFTLKASPKTIFRLERFGDLLVALMLLLIGWRTGVGSYSIWQSGETSMLVGFPIWIAYLAAVPGVMLAGMIALVQGAGWNPATASVDE